MGTSQCCQLEMPPTELGESPSGELADGEDLDETAQQALVVSRSAVGGDGMDEASLRVAEPPEATRPAEATQPAQEMSENRKWDTGTSRHRGTQQRGHLLPASGTEHVHAGDQRRTPNLKRTHNIDDVAIYDLDGKYIKDASAFHAYIRMSIKHPLGGDPKTLVMEMSGSIRVVMTDDKPEPEENHRLFEATNELGRAASERLDPIELKRWALRDGLRLDKFFEELSQRVCDAVARPEMQKRGASWEHPWDPCFYNCQHFAGDCIQVAAPRARQFYDECLMHKPHLLKLTAGFGLLGSSLAAVMSQGVMWDSSPDLDEWTSLFDKAKPGPEWTITKIDLYWRDCTFYAAALVSSKNRLSDHSEMHQCMKAFRKQLVLEEEEDEKPIFGAVPTLAKLKGYYVRYRTTRSCDCRLFSLRRWAVRKQLSGGR